MEDSLKTRKALYVRYYTKADFNEVNEKLPTIIEKAVEYAGNVIVPTIDERRRVIDVVRKFIRDNGKIVYGGTAIDEAIREASKGTDSIYKTDYSADIEFYSSEPVKDVVDLSNILYKAGFEFVSSQEAQHEETYNLHVNFKLYCDISYVPNRILRGIKTLVIDGIKYAHPHFIFIDQLRIFNQPLTAAEQRWMKTFPRMYKLLKYYKIEFFDNKINIDNPTDETNVYINDVKNYLTSDEIKGSCLITGFKAYNYFIARAMNNSTNLTKQSSLARPNNSKNPHIKQIKSTDNENAVFDRMLINVPYLEIISVSYRDSVEKIYNFLRAQVADPLELTFEEYYPLFQFTGYSVIIKYRNNSIIKIMEADGFCVPHLKTNSGLIYVSYQYLLMHILVSKFRSHLDKDQKMYFNYGVIFSNLIDARNRFLDRTGKGVINDTVFGEFKISCCGSTASYSRTSRLRAIERHRKGKRPFRYDPQAFFAQSVESQAKFDPLAHMFRNTSGNQIRNEKNLLFKFDSERNIVKDAIIEEATTDNKEELDRIRPDIDRDGDSDNDMNHLNDLNNFNDDSNDPSNQSDSSDLIDVIDIIDIVDSEDKQLYSNNESSTNQDTNVAMHSVSDLESDSWINE